MLTKNSDQTVLTKGSDQRVLTEGFDQKEGAKGLYLTVLTKGSDHFTICNTFNVDTWSYHNLHKIGINHFISTHINHVTVKCNCTKFCSINNTQSIKKNLTFVIFCHVFATYNMAQMVFTLRCTSEISWFQSEFPIFGSESPYQKNRITPSLFHIFPFPNFSGIPTKRARISFLESFSLSENENLSICSFKYITHIANNNNKPSSKKLTAVWGTMILA